MIFRIRFTFATLMRSLLLRGEKGRVSTGSAMVLAGALIGLMSFGAAQNLVGLGAAPGAVQNGGVQATKRADPPTHSTTIALTPDETQLVVVNREANTVSIIQVKNANGNDVADKVAEIGVGQEPRCVAVHPTG